MCYVNLLFLYKNQLISLLFNEITVYNFSTDLDVDPTNKKMLYMNEAGLSQILAKTKSADARFYGEKI